MKTGGINGISQRVHPAPILKRPKSVTWGHAETLHFQQDKWLAVPLLNEHAVVRKTAQIKSAPIVRQPIKPPAPVPIPPPVAPQWKWWQRILRGEGLAVIAPYVFVGSVIGIAMGGPVGVILPAGYVVLCIGAYAYRKFGPQAEVVAREQLTSAKLRQRFLRKAAAMHRAGDYQQAYVYEKLAKKIK